MSIKELTVLASKDKLGAWILVRALDTGRVLIGKRSKHVNNSGNWNFFGGGVDKGEKFIEGAMRELREELGVNVRGPIVKLMEFESNNRQNRYYLLDVREEFVPNLNSEHSKHKWVKPQDLDAYTMNPPTDRFIQNYNVKKLRLGAKLSKKKVTK
ncbi:nucleoside triphosphatase [Vibrio phage vB_VcorM_GR11A]|nr:nucleoside triphosphatase [Vibrio phage vB_VcorM_GR11A]